MKAYGYWNGLVFFLSISRKLQKILLNLLARFWIYAGLILVIRLLLFDREFLIHLYRMILVDKQEPIPTLKKFVKSQFLYSIIFLLSKIGYVFYKFQNVSRI